MSGFGKLLGKRDLCCGADVCIALVARMVLGLSWVLHQLCAEVTPFASGVILIYTSVNSSLIQLAALVCFSHFLCKMEIFPGSW